MSSSNFVKAYHSPDAAKKGANQAWLNLSHVSVMENHEANPESSVLVATIHCSSRRLYIRKEDLVFGESE